MFSRFPLSTPRRLEPFDVDEATLRFLESLPGVQVHPLPSGSYQVEIPQGSMAMQAGSNPNGNDTWLYRLPSGHVLGHDTEGAMPESVWEASELHWKVSTPFEFALVCWQTNLAAGHIPPNTPPPDPVDFEQ